MDRYADTELTSTGINGVLLICGLFHPYIVKY